jgi:response regulator RpfG family c-di-GMP phosphodiesterase
MTVLIIDDTPMTIYALSQILMPQYTVKVAKGGDIGLKLASENNISLIMLDIYMPDISGFEVLTKLKNNEKTNKIPVILISGTEETEDMEQGFSLGAVDFIKKPFDEKDVLQKTRKHITKRGF